MKKEITGKLKFFINDPYYTPYMSIIDGLIKTDLADWLGKATEMGELRFTKNDAGYNNPCYNFNEVNDTTTKIYKITIEEIE